MITATVELHGNFFSRQILRALHDHTNRIVDESTKLLVTTIQRNLDVAIYNVGGAHPDRYTPTGNYRRSINGRMVGSMHGEVHDSGIVYGPWLEGVSSRNNATRFKGYAAFRRATQDVDQKTGIIGARVIADFIGYVS